MTQMTSILVETADRIFQKAEPWPAGGFDAPLWSATEQAGLDRLLLPETLGGGGDAYVDAAAIAIASGKHAAAIPLIETMVANWCLARAGLDVPEGPKALLISHADGAATPFSDDRSCMSWRAGTEVAWSEAARASVILALHEDVLSVVRVDAPVPGARRETLAGEPVTLADGAPVNLGNNAIARWPHASDEPLALLALLKAAAIVGAAETLVACAIEYANMRVQFGRPIAAFQMIQQMIARMASEAAAAAAAVQYAAHTFDSQSGIFAAAVAKGRASEAAGQVAAAAHHVHGAIGFTEEHSLHRYSRRLWSWREEAGNETYWNAKLGSAAFQAGGDKLWAGMVNGLSL
jgi:acyl-CoA dehydrogenase